MTSSQRQHSYIERDNILSGGCAAGHRVLYYIRHRLCFPIHSETLTLTRTHARGVCLELKKRMFSFHFSLDKTQVERRIRCACFRNVRNRQS